MNPRLTHVQKFRHAGSFDASKLADHHNPLVGRNLARGSVGFYAPYVSPTLAAPETTRGPEGTTVTMPERTPIGNQGNLGSCTANRRCDGLELVMPKVIQLSRLAVYWPSRYQLGEQDQDAGSYSRITRAIVQEVGVCPESMWPYDDGPDAFKMRPDLSAELECARHLVPQDGIQRIVGSGAGRVNAAQSAVAIGCPVGIDIVVDQAFVDGEAKEPIEPPLHSVGGHAVLIVGYRITSAGKISFLLRNSWGKTWGRNGYCWISAEYLASPLHTTDVDVTTTGPVGFEAIDDAA